MAGGTAKKVFNFIMVKPSHYDDDGYVIQWAYSWIPSNTLAALYGLALDCAERRVLGDDVEIVLSAMDETNTRVKPKTNRQTDREIRWRRSGRPGRRAIQSVPEGPGHRPRASRAGSPGRDRRLSRQRLSCHAARAPIRSARGDGPRYLALRRRSRRAAWSRCFATRTGAS